MKKIISALLAVIITILTLSTNLFAVGSCVVSGQEIIDIPSQQGMRKVVTFTCTGDAGGIASYSFSPITFGVRGWYLYNITTNPGTSAPTADYDITLVVDGEDVAGGLLADRSATATQTKAIAATGIGYFMMDGTMAITFANETANPAVIVMTLRFTTN